MKIAKVLESVSKLAREVDSRGQNVIPSGCRSQLGERH
ncbi:bifunctional DNA-binding transcriptional regulator/antitoxin component of YhaV-PrlF toxin-antitoxin module, partial [Amorphus sp. MBR-141]